jgi:hypothetical protein
MSFIFHHWINWLSIVTVNMPLSLPIRLWPLVLGCIYIHMSLTKKKTKNNVTYYTNVRHSVDLLHLHDRLFQFMISTSRKFIPVTLSVCKSIETISIVCLLNWISSHYNDTSSTDGQWFVYNRILKRTSAFLILTFLCTENELFRSSRELIM